MGGGEDDLGEVGSSPFVVGFLFLCCSELID